MDLEAAHESPVEQARKSFLRYKDLLRTSPKLRHLEGPNLGQLRFPIGYCAVFTQITRKQAEQHGLLQVLAPVECLFSDDLSGDFDQAEARRVFVYRLKQAFLVRFPFTPLDADQLKALRALIFPEIKISRNQPAALSLRTSEQEELIAALDLVQERTAKSILDGHRVLKGVAGSGKTLVLTCRAQYLQWLQPTWRILIVCYTQSLHGYIEQMLTVEPQPGSPKIEVMHYHALVKTLTRVSLRWIEGETSAQWDSRVGAILLDGIRNGSVTARYDAILIDEGQDFAVEWLQSLTQLLNPATDSLLLCLDPAQNIFGRKVTYKSVGIKVQGKRPIMLNTTYRNTAEILTLARHFSGVKEETGDTSLEAETDPEQHRMDSLLFPIHTDRHGDKPKIIHGIPHQDQVAFIVDHIKQYIADATCQWRDIAVLYATSYEKFGTRFRNAMREAFPEERLYWVTWPETNKLALDLNSPSVKLSTIESAKGLEFRVVFLVGLEALPRTTRDEPSERKLVYVGLTRAQDLLYILGETPSGFFGELIEIVQKSNNS
jgi:superfamily I DNA/RNA helicase